MFNFKLYNMALEDANLTDKEFRMLCLFLNKSSMDKSDTIEMFNGFLMDKLDLRERWVKALTKSLCEKGYLTKTITGTKNNRNANTYTLKNTDNDAQKCAEKCAEKCTPNKEHINNNKNTYKDFSTCSNSTCMKDNNIKEKINKKESDFGDKSQMEKVNKNLNLIYMKENEMSDNGAIEMNAKSGMKWNGKQRSNNVAGCVKETITSTQGIKKENTVQNDKVLNNGSIFKEDCSNTPHPQIAPNPLSPNDWDESLIFGAGSTQTSPMDNLSTNDITTQQEALKCPKTEYNFKEWCETMNKLQNDTTSNVDIDTLSERLKMMDMMMVEAKNNINPRQYRRCCIDIVSWCDRQKWNMDFDKICLVGNFKRKYVA